jgi:NAD(P)-dependent dehydrogenase (short-subunit alcohol dehydrogenase family)
LQDVAGEINSKGGEAVSRVADVTHYDEVAEAVQFARQTFGHPKVLINNAGQIEPIGRFLDTDLELWTQNIMVNLIGAQNAVRALFGDQTDLSGSVIVNISTGAAKVPREGWSAYCCAKAGVAMFTQHLHSEYGKQGLRVMGYIPGFVDTVMQEKIRASGINEISRMTREDMTPPERPAKVIAFLCSPEAAEFAGQELSFQDQALNARVF